MNSYERLMYYTENDLKKLHEIELDILTEVDRVCEECGIHYFLDFGTLLGAIRHGGFIPWDDDIDITMLRDDYDKFIAIAPDYLKKGYSLQHYLYDSAVPAYHAKVRKDNTLFIEESVINNNIHQGIFIDIFPCDKVPNSYKKRKIHYYSKCLKRSIYVSKSLYKTSESYGKMKKIVFDLIRKLLHLSCKHIKKSVFYSLLDNNYQKYNKSNSNYYSSGGKASYPIEAVIPLQKITFEGRVFYGPHDPDYILKCEYGDYMKLPDEQHRKTHAPILLDFGE